MRLFTVLAMGTLAAVVLATSVAALAKAGRGATGVRPADVPAEDRRAVLDGNVAFALDAYAKLREDSGNFVFSPLSLSAALAMTTAAAQGSTRTQMAGALHLDLPQDRLDDAFQSVLSELRPSRGSRARLDIANALWTAREFPFRRDFVVALRTHYGARATP